MNRGMPRSVIGVFLLSGGVATFAVLLVSARATDEAVPPTGGVALMPPSYRAVHVFPVALADGTRCVAMAGEQRSGVSITCDWTQRNKP
jgi:hypothetical protein